nr:PREDICTED: kinesin-like protein KIF19 [Equus przewalskii]
MEPKDQQLMVALRIRPLNDTELEEGATAIAHKVGDQMAVLMDPGEDPEDTLRAHHSREKAFIFDTVFDQHASQEDVYRATTQQLVEGVISGYNATVFAYGPSGAGKTHTMLGTDTEPGIYLRTLADLFQAIEESRDGADCRVSMSYLEIYNEVIRDLLNPASGFLELREDSRGSIQIAGITEVSTSHAQEIMQLLTKGNRQRSQEPTATNRTSSRSHAVLQVTVRQRRRGTDLAEEVHVGRLFLVDLAGSERASQTQNQGKRMKEGAHINRSLLALGNCINALSEKGSSRTQYVNFRDSKLTRLLKDALGGNSRTVMIAHISPASTSFEESRTTLLYAYRAKNIKTRVKRNLLNVSLRIAQYTDVISDLRREIERLKSKLETRETDKRSDPGGRDAQGRAEHGPAASVGFTIPCHDTEEDGRVQMNKIRAQLIGAFKEQLEMRRSLVELENTHMELHIDVSRHLLTIADWERVKTQQHAHGDRTPARDEEPAEANADTGEGESMDPHEVALAREEVNMLLAEQRKTAALKVGERARARPHPSNDGGIPEPEPLAQRYRLYSRELGEGALPRLLLLHSVLASSLRDGSVLSLSPPPEESSREQPDDRKDLPWGAQFEPMLLETDSDGSKSSKATPSKKPGKQDSLLPPSSLRVLLTPPVHEKPGSLRAERVAPSLRSPGGPEPGSPRTAEAPLSARALKEMAASTKSIARIAATRRSRAQDREAGSGRSSRHLPEEVARGPSPADRRWPHASLCRDHSGERKARSQRSPSVTWSVQPVGGHCPALGSQGSGMDLSESRGAQGP